MSAHTDSDMVIEQFVSTLVKMVHNEVDKQIILRIRDLRAKCKDEYIQSEEFRQLVISTLEKIKRNKKKFHVHVRNLYTSMKQNFDQTDKYIKKLERALKKCDKRIKRLEKKEISLDEMDSGNSAYVLGGLYKEKFMAIYRKICELKKTSSRVKNNMNKRFHYNVSRYPELNTAVENFMNSIRALPDHYFPDYRDILQVVKDVNENFHLGLSQSAVHDTAKEIFRDVGRELKSRREDDYHELFGSHLTDSMENEPDPAETDPSLKQTLDQNFIDGQAKIEKMISEYTEKQSTLKLKPKEVPDEKVCLDPENSIHSDDEEEDRMIEKEQIEEEKWLNDNIDNMLDEQEEAEDDKTSDVELLDECNLSSLSNSKFAEVDKTAETALNVSSGNQEILQSSRSCMARLKVTPSKAETQMQSKNVLPSQIEKSQNLMEMNSERPAKRIRLEPVSLQKNNPSDNQNLSDVIWLE